MTGRHRQREIARRLRDVPAGEPPAALLGRLRADVPTDLAERLDADRDEPAPSAPARPLRTLRWVPVAAALTMLLGGGFLVWRVFDGVRLVERAAPEPAAVREAAAGGEGAAHQAPVTAGRGEGDESRAVAGDRGGGAADLRAEMRGSAARAPDVSAARKAEEPRPTAAPPPPDAGDADLPAPGAEATPLGRRETEGPGPSAALQAAREAKRAPIAEPPPAAVFAEPSPAPPDLEVGAEAPPSLGEARTARLPAVPFVETAAARRSTFALDVPAGSGAERRVRIGRTAPRGRSFGLLADGGPSPFRDDPRFRLLRFVVQAVGPGSDSAEEVRAQVEIDEGAVVRWRALGHQSLTVEGAIGPGDSVTALYEIELAEGPPLGELASVGLRWRDANTGLLHEIERPVRPGDLAPTWDAASPGFRLAAIAAAFAETLSSPSPDPERLAELARRAEALAEETGEAVALARRIRRAERLRAGSAP